LERIMTEYEWLGAPDAVLGSDPGAGTSAIVTTFWIERISRGSEATVSSARSVCRTTMSYGQRANHLFAIAA
jgi:hypothetical protein